MKVKMLRLKITIIQLNTKQKGRLKNLLYFLIILQKVLTFKKLYSIIITERRKQKVGGKQNERYHQSIGKQGVYGM